MRCVQHQESEILDSFIFLAHNELMVKKIAHYEVFFSSACSKPEESDVFDSFPQRSLLFVFFAGNS